MFSKRAEYIIRQFPDPILVLKNNFQVEYVNAALEKMLCISSKTILKKKSMKWDWKLEKAGQH